MTLQQAVDLINSVQRGPEFPDLLAIVKCHYCQHDFPVQTQISQRSQYRKNKIFCRQCAEHHRKLRDAAFKLKRKARMDPDDRF